MTGITVIRFSLPESPGASLYAICRQELADRLTADAVKAGQGGVVEDLGRAALDVANSVDPDDLERGTIRNVGIARDGRWVRWFPPVPPEPVPGSPEQRGGRN